MNTKNMEKINCLKCDKIAFVSGNTDGHCSFCHKEKADIERMKELSEDLNVEIVSYGLAPNPFGYCLSGEDRSNVPKDKESQRKLKELEALCDTAPRGALN